MKREDLLKSPHYWLAQIQSDLYSIIHEYMDKNKLKQKDIAKILGVSKGYVSQILNGDFDHKLSKMIEISLAFGKVPNLKFVDIIQYTNANKVLNTLDNNIGAAIVKMNVTANSNSTIGYEKRYKDLEPYSVNDIINIKTDVSRQIAYN